MRKLKNNSCRLLKNISLMLACASMFGYQTPTFAEDVKPTNSNIANRVTIEEDTYTVDGNTVEHDGELNDVYGGGNEQSASDVTENQVLINGGNIDAAIGGISASGNVSNNTIEINGGTINGAVGGVSVINHELGNAAGNVTGNRVIIHGGNITFVSGGEVAYTYSGIGGTYDESLARAVVSNNTVEIDGGTI